MHRVLVVVEVEVHDERTQKMANLVAERTVRHALIHTTKTGEVSKALKSSRVVVNKIFKGSDSPRPVVLDAPPGLVDPR